MSGFTNYVVPVLLTQEVIYIFPDILTIVAISYLEERRHAAAGSEKLPAGADIPVISTPICQPFTSEPVESKAKRAPSP